MFDPDQFLRAWQSKANQLLGEALGFLAALADWPLSDGVLGDWIRQLEKLPFDSEHLSAIEALFDKPDPLLQEAGILLAAAASDRLGETACQFEQPLAKVLATSDVDPWLVHASVRLLSCHIGPHGPQFIEAHQALVAWLALPPTQTLPGPRQIFRTMYIDPRSELIDLFVQQALQTLMPTKLIEVLLPVLEHEHGTSGWVETFDALLNRMGFDPDDHRRRLSG